MTTKEKRPLRKRSKCMLALQENGMKSDSSTQGANGDRSDLSHPDGRGDEIALPGVCSTSRFLISNDLSHCIWLRDPGIWKSTNCSARFTGVQLSMHSSLSSP